MDVFRLKALLANDLDTHLLTLKFLGLYGDSCEVAFEQQGDAWASLVSMPAQLFAWDRINYPEAERIVFLDGTEPSCISAVWGRRPGGNLVLKSSDPRCQAAVEGAGLVSRRSFIWYTTQDAIPVGTAFPASGAILCQPAEGEARQIILANGYTAAELDRLMEQGAFVVAAGPPGTVASVCFVYPNHGAVWEIASVKTLERFRRQGWARHVVGAACSRLLAEGRRIRYHVESTNGPSRTLAEAVGLRPYVVSHHYPMTAR